MPRISDLLRQDAKGVFDAGLLEFSTELRVSLQRATELLQTYGGGYVYARGGNIVLEDTPRNRTLIATRMNVAVIVERDGTIGTWTRRQEQSARMRVAKGKKRNRMRKERARLKAEEAEYLERKHREAWVRACGGTVNRKRQGKGDSLGDIGRYVPHYNPRIESVDAQMINRTIFASIKIRVSH